MNPTGTHPMNMDRMIFEINPGICATSLYIILCSHVDEGERPSLKNALRAWNSTEENLVQAARELIDLNIISAVDPLDFDGHLLLNPREKWSWCRATAQRNCLLRKSNGNGNHA